MLKSYLVVLVVMITAPLYGADSYELKWEYTTNVDSLRNTYTLGTSGLGNYDYDGDGYTDVVVISYGGNPTVYQLRILSGRNHDMLFAPITMSNFPQITPASDMDLDGEPEFVLSHYTHQIVGGELVYNSKVEVYSGRTGKKEWFRDNIASPVTVANLSDFDNDGRNEFLFSTWTNNHMTISVYGATGVARVGTGELTLPREVSVQSYPNPFNSDTFIEFTLPQAGSVQISLFDGTGRQLAVRRMENLPAGVARTALSSLTPSQLPSGTYFVDVSQDGSGTTRQIIKLR